jgi:molecular chaperone DnaK (HSP70)
LASSQIGIKIADGTFYPVLDEGTNEKKRLVLTTVKDKQENVQIDLYRSSDGSLEEADYVGSLVIENITPAPSGEPEVEVILGIDEEDTLGLRAINRAFPQACSICPNKATILFPILNWMRNFPLLKKGRIWKRSSQEPLIR